MTTQVCLACHEDGDDLQPLYVERSADAQPIAWAHKRCLEPQTAEEAAQEQAAMLESVDALNRWRKANPDHGSLRKLRNARN